MTEQQASTMTQTTGVGTIRTVIESFWAAHSTGDREALKDIVSERIEWTVVGKTVPIAKKYTGHDGFFNELLGALDASFVPGTVKMELKNLFVDEDAQIGVIELFESATTTDGKQFSNNIINVLEVSDGQVTVVREYMDLAEVKDAFGF